MVLTMHVAEQGHLRGDIVAVLFLSTSILFFVVHHLLPVEAASVPCLDNVPPSNIVRVLRLSRSLCCKVMRNLKISSA